MDKEDRRWLEERDRRYTERFDAQERAMSAALVAAEKAVDAALAAVEKATSKAEIASREWQANANEWRGQLSDQGASFITRIEFEAKYEALSGRFDAQSSAIEARTAAVDTKLGQMIPRTETASRLAGLEASIASVSSRLDSREGRSSGLNAGWGYLVAAVVLASSVIVTIVALR